MKGPIRQEGVRQTDRERQTDRQKDWPTNGDKREKTGIECRGGRREREREIGWYA